MAESPYAMLGVVAAIVLGSFWLVYRWRFSNFSHIPSPLKRNLFIGHLGYIGKEMAKPGASEIHPDYAMEQVWIDHGKPDVLFMDLRPLQYPVLLVCSHDVAEQISRSTKAQPYSVTKSPTIQEGFRRLVGTRSMLSADGEEWKNHRKRFNPGFAPQHVTSLITVVIDKTRIFMEKLDAIATSGRAVEMESYCTNVTFDIITDVVCGFDSKAQDETIDPHPIVKDFANMIPTYAGDNGIVPTWLNVPMVIRRYRDSQSLDRNIKKCVQDKWNETRTGTTTLTKSDRSVLALALKDTEDLTSANLQSIADQVKTFLFAGHDTTSILLQRLFYALSVHPQCLAKIRAEHDQVFGNAEPADVMLAKPEETMKSLVYTSACIKEALRLWPPAGAARMSRNGFTIRTSDGDEFCVDDCVLYSCQHIIQRDEKVYGSTANDFVPERWIGDTDTSSENKDADGTATGASKIPISAWRPFERGPRNCIGQELANLEARVILACVMRRYDFVKVGVGEIDADEKGNPVIDAKGKYRTKSELKSMMSITSKPMDKTVMKIKLRV